MSEEKNEPLSNLPPSHGSIKPQDAMKMIQAKRNQTFVDDSDTASFAPQDVDVEDSENEPSASEMAQYKKMLNKGGVIGVNQDTGRPIVAGKQLSETNFVKPENFEELESKKFKSIEELLKTVAETSQYHPFTLPSGGYFYDKSSPLSAGEIYIRPMKAPEEEILSTPRLFKSGEALDMVFQRCVLFGDKSPLRKSEQLLSLDRYWLMIAIRILTYGPEYEFSMSCGSCRSQFDGVQDLDSLETSVLDEENKISEPIKSIFPESKVPFEFRLSRGYDEIQILKHMDHRKRIKGDEIVEDGFLKRAKSLVISVAGFTEKEAINGVIDNLVGKDLNHLRKCLDSLYFGVDARICVDCPHCGSENRVGLPLGPDFFIPRVRTKKN